MSPMSTSLMSPSETTCEKPMSRDCAQSIIEVTIAPDCVAAMVRDPTVFACANPVPEIWPWKAHAAGDANPDAYGTDRRTAAQPSMITPGLRMPFGSSVRLSRRISAISSGVRLDPRYARLATPMPCSADTEPDGGSAPYTISSMV